MNVLFVDPSLEPDLNVQRHILKHFRAAGDFSIRFATGILDATWQARDYQPDVIVFECIGDCEHLRKLIAMLRRINPDVTTLHLDGDSLVMVEDPAKDSARSTVPLWLRNMALPWIFERQANVPAM